MFGNAPLGSHYLALCHSLQRAKTQLPSFHRLRTFAHKHPGVPRLFFTRRLSPRGQSGTRRPSPPAQTIRHLKNSPNSDSRYAHTSQFGCRLNSAVFATHSRSEGLGMTPDASQSAGSRRALALASLCRSRFLRCASHLRRRSRSTTSQRSSHFPQTHRRLLPRLEHRQSDKPAKFYSQDAGRVFYDFSRHSPITIGRNTAKASRRISSTT